jgi:PKD repeat protein
MRHSFLACSAALALAVSSACTMKDQETPDLNGPSEFGTSIGVAITPDIIQQDGASQSLVTVTARNSSGQPVSGVSLRAEIIIDGALADFGTLSARNLVTGSDGRATLTYTAPSAPAGIAVDNFTIVQIAVTPLGSDFGNSAMRTASLRLVPRGSIGLPDGLRPAFTFTPEQPADNQTVLFDASSSLASANNPIVSYSWDFGEGDRGSGRTTSHDFDSPGTYVVTLTVADAYNRTAAASRSITVGAGLNPTARAVISPSPARVNTQVNFNGGTSVAAPGRTIVSYTWDFGDGSPIASGQQASHVYTVTGAYTVVLTVTDDVGRKGTVTATLTINP